jgi:hypothetical protein
VDIVALQNWFLCCFFIGLIGMYIELIRTNRSLSDELRETRIQRGLEARAGTTVPALHGLSLTGAPVELAHPDRATLLMVFSPSCGFCERNWPHWQAILKQLNRERIRPALVDLSSTASASFLSGYHVDRELFIKRVDPAAYAQYSFRVTPQTILINRNGTVAHVWTGLLTDQEQKEILSYGTKI